MDIGSKLYAFYNFVEDYEDKFNSFHLTNAGSTLHQGRAVFDQTSEKIYIPEYGVFAGDVPFALELKIEDIADSPISPYISFQGERSIVVYRQGSDVIFGIKVGGAWQSFSAGIDQQNINHIFFNFFPGEKIEIWNDDALLESYSIGFSSIDLSDTESSLAGSFLGGIYHFAVYHDTLTAEDIDYLFNSGSGRDNIDDLTNNTIEYSPALEIVNINTNSIDIRLTGKTDRDTLQSEGISLASFHIYDGEGNLIASDPEVVIADNLDDDNYPTTLIQISQLDEGQEYQFYGVMEYTELAITTDNSPVQSVTTLLGNQPPDKPACETSNITGASATLSALLTDPDGNTMSVQFIDAINGDQIGVVTNVANGDIVTVEWTGLQAGYTYQWYAVANDGEVWGEQSDTMSFITPVANRKPTTPEIFEITPTITNASIKANISDPDGNSLSAKLYGKLSTDVDFTLIDEKTGLTDLATFTWSGLTPDTEYQVYVVTNDGTLDSDPSSTVTFKTQQAIAPEITQAETRNIKTDRATLHVRFLRKNTTDITVHYYNASDDSLIISIPLSAGFSESAHLLSGLAVGTEYSWYATVEDGYSTSDLSIVQTFTTLANNYPPDKPVIHGVSNITGNSADLDVEATDPDGNRMILEIWTVAGDVTSPVADSLIKEVRDIAPNTHTISLDNLLPNSEYRLFCRTNDGSLDSEYSDVVTFNTAEAPAKPVEPITKHITPTSVVLRVKTQLEDIASFCDMYFYNADNDELIGISTHCAHGLFVEVQWGGLVPNREYSWYAKGKMSTGYSEPSDTTTFETLFSNYENLDNLPFVFSNSGWKNITGFEFFEGGWQLPESVEVYKDGAWHKLNYAQFEMQKCPIYRRNMKDGYMFEMGVVLNNVPPDMEVDEVGILVKYAPSEKLTYNDHDYKENLYGTMRDGYYGCFTIPYLSELQEVAYRIYARVGTTIFYCPEDFDSSVVIIYMPSSYVEGDTASLKHSAVNLNSKLTKKLMINTTEIDQVTIYDSSMFGMSGILGNAFLCSPLVSLMSYSQYNCFTVHNEHKLNINNEYGVE